MSLIKINKDNPEKLIIEIPYSLISENENIREFFEYIKIKKYISESEASQQDIENLINEVKDSMWKKNKDSFLKGIKE